ncbi:hypothetical protein OSB04_016428 [Centaurea solstitialis]|uniref:Uncharacterized protein n=1 Tax=Centaurea solstitialis TaxID=347529 RepID=A0AA38TKY3_9ASTR|nr:hypothetical protein OSB04_016428 [Centaurea solstitialis]
MDVAVIDWKDSKFEKDNLYEDINAPQWIDFSHDDPPVDDEAWFCRPDCNHPKTVEDFFRQRTPDSAKLQRSASVSEIRQLGDRLWRDAALKKRGFPSNTDSKSTKSVQDSENQNPNFSTPPPNHKARSIKEMIKSSSEKNDGENGFLVKEEPPRVLKSTLSARNLFAGRDILNQVTEFCNEMKRLATRAKDNGEKEIAKKVPVAIKKQEVGVLQESKNDRKPLLEVKKEKYEETEKASNAKQKLIRKKMNDESENTPIALNIKSIRGKDEERVLQIRTNPPSPQCFSANNGATKAAPPKPFRLRPQERGILQEIEKTSSKEVKKGNTNQTAPVSVSSPQNEAKGYFTKNLLGNAYWGTFSLIKMAVVIVMCKILGLWLFAIVTEVSSS